MTDRRPPACLLRQAASLAFLFVLAFVVLNLVEDFSFFGAVRYQLERRDIPNGLRNAVIYAGVYAWCLAGLCVLYGHAWRAVRWPALAASAVAVVVYLTFAKLNGYGFTYHEAAIFWAETSFLDDALVFFAGSYLPWLGLCLLAIFAYERWIFPRLVPHRSLLLLLVPLLALPVHAELLRRTHSKVYETPLPYRIPMLVHYAYDYRMLYTGPREEPSIEPTQPPLADHVVVVMDESVRGDLLGINGSSYRTTPKLEALGDAVQNYGVASALSNLSSSSNIMLQSGLRPDQVPDRELKSLKSPSLFGYMKHAGFHTFLIDAQIYSDKPTNFMTRWDLEAMDAHMFVRRQYAGLPEYEMDFAAIDELVRIASEHDRTFTYLFKTGAHFPYEDKYPPQERIYEPTLAIGEVTRGRVETLNSYLNALAWTVDTFLVTLRDAYAANGLRALVIYTSDHGQSLIEPHGPDGEPFMGFPHATPVDPPIEQAMVPLILFGTGEVREALARRYHPDLVHCVSSFEIFPTVMIVGGYAPEDVRTHYHHSLFDADANRSGRFFVSGNLFGRGRTYQNPLVRSGTQTFLNPFELPEGVGPCARADAPAAP